MKVYIKDNKIVKTIMSAWYETETPIEWAEVVEMNDTLEHIIYENSQVKLYKESQAIQDRKTELEWKTELTESEQEELNYINGLLS